MKKSSKKRDTIIIIVLLVCGVFINTLFVTLKYQLSFTYNSSLNSYIKIKISEDDLYPIEENEVSMFLLDNFKTDVVMKMVQNNILYILDMSHNFDEIEILTGRYFSLEDFQNARAVAVISSSRIDEIEKDNSTQYIRIAGEMYEVIGTFDSDNYSQSIFINIMSPLSKSYGFPIDGEYLISSTENSKLDAWKEFIVGNNGSIEVINQSLISSMTRVLSDYSSVILAFLLCIIAIALNAINGIYYWLLKRKDEISIRLLVGATQNNIIRMLFIDYTKRIIIAFMGSVLICFVVFKSMSISGLTISLWTALASGILLYIIGIIILALALRGFIKKDISIQVSGE